MTTDRLFLRERTNQMNINLISFSDKKQMEFLGIDDPKELNSQIEKIKKSLNNKNIGHKWWDIIESKSNSVIGSCGLHSWHPEHERAELGYNLHEKYRGNKYMIEAVTSVLVHGFKEMKLNRIEALVGLDNIPSIKIIEKSGFTKEGILREHYKENGEITNSLIYSLLKSEFKNK